MKKAIQNEIESRVKTAHAVHSATGYSGDVQIIFCYERDGSWRAQSYNSVEGTFANWMATPESVQLVD
jgi:hypothetical protein